MSTTKTRRGVYYRLEDSDILVEHKDKVYKFTSYKKRDMFFNRVYNSLVAVEKLRGKIYKYTGGDKSKDYSLEELCDLVYDKVYNDMMYK